MPKSGLSRKGSWKNLLPLHPRLPDPEGDPESQTGSGARNYCCIKLLVLVASNSWDAACCHRLPFSHSGSVQVYGQQPAWRAVILVSCDEHMTLGIPGIHSIKTENSSQATCTRRWAGAASTVFPNFCREWAGQSICEAHTDGAPGAGPSFPW